MRIDMNARTADILATVAGRPNPPFCVGFSAENQDVGAICGGGAGTGAAADWGNRGTPGAWMKCAHCRRFILERHLLRKAKCPFTF
jgi:hypothetical protein